MNTTTKTGCVNGCKHHCSLCDRHGVNKVSVPQGWLRVARGRFVCDGCQYMARMSESDPEYVTRIAKMAAEAQVRFSAWLAARGGVA